MSNQQRREPQIFTPLKDIVSLNLGVFVNVAGVVVDHKVTAQCNSGDYWTRVKLCDNTASLVESAITVDFFHKNPGPRFHPPVASNGDYIIVYRAKVQLRDGVKGLISTFYGQSTQYSLQSIDSGKMTHSTLLPCVNGLALLNSLKKWWNIRGGLHTALGVPKSDREVVKVQVQHEAKKGVVPISKVEENCFHDLSGFVVKVYTGNDRWTLVYITDYTKNEKLFDYDEGWGGPGGKYTLQVTVWAPNDRILRSKVNVLDWVRLKNVRGHKNRNGYLEGTINTDENRQLVHKVAKANWDSLVNQCLHRKKEYEKRHKKAHEASQHGAPGKQQQQKKKQKSGANKGRCEISSMDFNYFYDLCGMVLKTYTGHDDNASIYITDYTANDNLYPYDEILDGEWSGPWGQYSLQITVWEPYCRPVNDLYEGDWVRLYNVQSKVNGDGRLEGTIREIRSHEDRRDRIEKLDASEVRNDSCVQLCLQRMKEYEKRRKLGQEPISHAAHQKRAEKRQSQKNPNADIKLEEDDPYDWTSQLTPQNASPSASSRITISPSPSPSPSPVPCPYESIVKNKYIKINNASPHHITPIEEIISNRAATTRYRICCRVVDYQKSSLEQFAGLEDEVMELTEGEDEDEDPKGRREKRMSSPVATGRKEWVWRFALLLEDAVSGEKLSAYVTEKNAEHLLNLSAGDLSGRKNQLLAQLREKMFILWGNLEETKVAKAAAKAEAEAAATKSGEKRNITSEEGRGDEKRQKTALGVKENGKGKGREGKGKEKRKGEREGKVGMKKVGGKPFECFVEEFSGQNRSGVVVRKWRMVWTTIH